MTELLHQFPQGLKFWLREGTTDYNTVAACTFHDEYGLVNVPMDGMLVFDLGAHIGGVSVACAARGATVVAVEPVPDNAALVKRNAEANELLPWVTVVEAAAGESGHRRLLYGFGGSPNADAHSFIGNTYPETTSTAPGDGTWVEKLVPSYSLTHLCHCYGVPDILKVDCEGGEWAVLADRAIDAVPLIVGEWHPVDGHGRDEVVTLLSKHDVIFTGPEAGPGGFTARRR